MGGEIVLKKEEVKEEEEEVSDGRRRNGRWGKDVEGGEGRCGGMQVKEEKERKKMGRL